MDIRRKLLVTAKLPDPVTQRLLGDYNARTNGDDHPMPADEILAAAEGRHALLISGRDRLSADLILRLPSSVEMIATCSAGHDHIDLQACRRRNLPVSNTPDVLTEATADIALLLILGAARRAYEGMCAIQEGTWRSSSLVGMLGTHVGGKNLGILGMGRIGQAVARRARSFDMKIHYFSRRRLPEQLELDATFHSNPETMLSRVQILSLHVPALPETRHWLDERRIARLPEGAIVVNTARGTLIEDQALIAALRSGKLLAAGLDVFENEPDLDPAYRTLSNVFLLPHLGSATIETRVAMGYRALDNLDAFFAGAPLIDRVA